LSDSPPGPADSPPPEKADAAHDPQRGGGHEGGTHEGRGQHLLHWLLVAASVMSLREQARSMARNFALRTALLGVAALLWLATVGFLIAILVVWLASVAGTLAALGIVAAGLALIAIVLHVIAARIARRRRARSWQTPFSEINQALHAGNFDEAAIGALMLAAISGLILGFRSGKR
jgi:hypothetical protein